MSINIIGLHGLSGVGKDTLVSFTREKHPNSVHLKFALPLRAIVYTLLDLPWSKGTVGNKLFETNHERSQTVTDWLISFNDVYRPIVPDLMVRGLRTVLNDVLLADTTPSLVIVSDVRQVNEYECITNLGGRIVHLTREVCAREPRELDNLLSDYPKDHLPLLENRHWDNVESLEKFFTPTTPVLDDDAEHQFVLGLKDLIKTLRPWYITCEVNNFIATVLDRLFEYHAWTR